MSITDELRKVAAKTECANGRCEKLYRGDLEHIADLIDAEHERAMADAELAAAPTEAQLEEWGYVELPKDADGVPIHVGDVMEWPYGNGEFIVEGIGGNTLFYIDKDSGECEWTAAGDKRHHHAPTVEDVLREFTDEVWNRCCEGATASDSGIDELVDECAAKLRLAGEDE